MPQVDRIIAPVAAALSLALAATSCSPNRGPEDVIDPSGSDQLVLDAVLIVGRPFPPIYLSRTSDPLGAFSFPRVAETGAQLEIRSGGERVATYSETGAAGTYDWRGSPVFDVVMAETEYEVIATTADGRTVRGSTVTPPHFSVREWLLLADDGESVRDTLATFEEAGGTAFARNNVVYADGVLEARFDRPDVPAFQVAVRNLEESSPLLVDPDFLSDEDLANLERSLSSPPLVADDSTLRLPWLAIYYEGRTMIRVHAVDRNWFDLIRSTPGLDNGPGAFAFGGNLGEGFEQPVFHIDGGIGLVGSASTDSLGFTVTAP